MTLNILLCHHLTNFNSHTREGVTFAEKYAAKSSSNFNSHTREGVTFAEKYAAKSSSNFNSHTREGVTIILCPRVCSLTQFQLTHP